VIFGSTASLSGTATDFNGDPITFSWRIISRPGGSGCAIDDPSAQNTFFVPDVPGQYLVGFTANDGTDDSVEATVTLTVNVNTPPVADAGADDYVYVGAPASLDGSLSSDAEGHGLTFAWTVGSAPGGSGAGLVGPTSATPSITPDVLGDYTLELVVNDGYDDSAPATVVLHAVANIPPENDAGPDQAVLLGDTVSLNGAGCSDAEGDAFTLGWTFTGTPVGSGAALDDAGIVAPSFEPDLAGLYTLALVADDGAARPPDEVDITVAANLPPAAGAGDDFATRRDDVVYCSAAGSGDPEGRALTYTWTLTSQPASGTAVLSDADTSAPSFTPDVNGDYTLELVVNDGYQDSPVDTVVVTAVDNFAPIADAGEDFALMTGRYAYLPGHGSWDADNDLLDFSWSFDSVPAGSSAAFGSYATRIWGRFMPDLAGVYVVRLVVSDGQVSSPPDTVTITASGTPLAPTVDGGGTQLAIMGFEYHFRARPRGAFRGGSRHP
jgi:hypothetical protein